VATADTAPAAPASPLLKGSRATYAHIDGSLGGHATERLIPLFYAELRAIAAQRLAGERAGHSLQVTALTHEAVLRIMAGVGGDRWNDPGDFFAAASEAMRRILVESARRRKALKRGGGQGIRYEISSLGLPADDDDHELLVVNDTLAALAASDGLAAEIVRLRYFGGMTVPEVAAALGVPARTVDRRWAYARAWLGRHLRRAETVPPAESSRRPA